MKIPKFKDFFKEMRCEFICEKYGIRNYSINNGLVDVDGGVDLHNKGLSKLPLKFGKVSGYFSCGNNQLKTLEGCPSAVGGNFFCNDNQLTTLEGGPNSVGGYFNCYNNQIKSLEGGPSSIGGYFNCQNNQITDFRGFIEFFDGRVYFGGNPVQELLDLFPFEKRSEAIYWFNEIDVINGRSVGLDRLIEVFNQLNVDVIDDIEDIKFENYKVE